MRVSTSAAHAASEAAGGSMFVAQSPTVIVSTGTLRTARAAGAS